MKAAVLPALVLIFLGSACHTSGQEWPAWPAAGPLVVSRPPAGVDEYFVEMKPGFDQETYAKIISKRVKGKIGYVYKNFDAFTIYDVSEADIEGIRQMPEVKSVTKSGYGKLATVKFLDRTSYAVRLREDRVTESLSPHTG